MSKQLIGDSYKGAGVGLTLLPIIIGIIALIAVLGGGGTLLYLKTFGVATENARTDVIRNSNQYVTTQQTALIQKMEDYRRLDVEIAKGADAAPLRAQQAAIIIDMKKVVGTIPSDRIPEDVRAFLAIHQ